MASKIKIFIFILTIEIICSLSQASETTEDPMMHIQYKNYLHEVMDVLESDPEFEKLLENSTYEEIISGKIPHLKFLSHDVRTELDEIKRDEVERLDKLIQRKQKLLQIPDHQLHEYWPQHVDTETDAFSLADLEKLIAQLNFDLDKIDDLRRQEFKNHEMQKELERRLHLQGLNETERKKAEEEHQKYLDKRKKHKKINIPGSNNQLLEVWIHEDSLQYQDFEPKTFFKLHDLNNDDLLDEFEIEALFENELNKLFNSTVEPFDPMEREEEMNRMRENFDLRIDKDKDGVVSLLEFITYSKSSDFNKNEDWKSVEDETQFSEEEFQQYSKNHEKVTPHSNSLVDNSTLSTISKFIT